jgi:SAM-dependent methyltransferase
MYGKVLDVGCGDAIYLWGGRPPDFVTCVDLDVYPHTHVQAAAEALPFRDGSFDTALLFEVLEHVDDVGAVLSEALRIAKRVIISYPNESAEECKVRRPDVNAFIAFERAQGLREAYAEGDAGFRAHYHWKTRERMLRDVELLRRRCQMEFKLRYPDYDGWGFVCDRQA